MKADVAEILETIIIQNEVRKYQRQLKKRIDVLNSMYEKHHSKETKEKLRKTNLGKKMSIEAKQKIIQNN